MYHQLEFVFGFLSQKLFAEVARLLMQAGQPPKVLTAANLVGKEKAIELFESAYHEHAHRLAKLYQHVGKPKK